MIDLSFDPIVYLTHLSTRPSLQTTTDPTENICQVPRGSGSVICFVYSQTLSSQATETETLLFESFKMHITEGRDKKALRNVNPYDFIDC